MQFNSFGYMFFLIIIFVLHWVIPAGKRWIALLVFSYYFYMSWEPKYIVLICASTFISYMFALMIEKAEGRRTQKILMITGVVIILGLLFVFKYFNFASTNIVGIFRYFSIPVQEITLKLLLPVGISFYTFQTLSYLIDVYWGKIRAEKHLGYYALFVSFFPQLVAGPIERPENLLPQLRKERKFDYNQAKEGLILIAVGLFKKIVIANTLAKGVDVIYNHLYYYEGFVLIIATVMFAFQIYCDFGGYSDIAIGSAKLLNINLMQNFNCPYFAVSIKDFWGRWHISLSKWLRDYVYIPLGGNRAGKWKQYRNLFVTFLLSGLWHGAEWTFILWGGLHGVYQSVEHAMFGAKSREILYKNGYRRFFGWLITFSLVCFAWIFFRANALEDAFYIIGNMFNGIMNPLQYLKAAYEVPHAISKWGTVILGLEMLLLFAVDLIQYRTGSIMNYFHSRKKWVKYLTCIIFIMVLLLCSVKNAGGEFIYFQF